MVTESTPLQDVKNPCGRFRFRIATLLLLTLTVGIAASWWSDQRRLYSQQSELQNKIRQQARQILRLEVDWNRWISRTRPDSGRELHRKPNHCWERLGSRAAALARIAFEPNELVNLAPVWHSAMYIIGGSWFQ